PLISQIPSGPDDPQILTEYQETNPLLTGERSTARCPYAAAEGWSEVEVEIYCNREPTEDDF
ncbi:MAG: hypothetical protein AAFY47_12705, partial [Pseudomonadota bacterium]